MTEDGNHGSPTLAKQKPQKVRDPFRLRNGGLSLFVGATMNLVAILSNLSQLGHADAPVPQLLALVAASLIVSVACGWMWLKRYYLPWRRAKAQR